MFGFGGRRKFNGTVDTKLNNEYQIDTNNLKNPKFPGSLRYLEMIDLAWSQKLSADEAALYIAVLYFSGILRKGHVAEANALRERIQSIGAFCLPRGMISQEWWDKFSSEVEKVSAECEVSKYDDFDDDIPY